MFRDLQRQNRVEPSTDVETQCQVMGHVPFLGDLKQGSRYVITVDSEDVLDPMGPKDRQPGTQAAAHVNDAAGPEQLEDEGDDFPSRLQ